MVLPNRAFDALLFGLLLVAAVVDSFFALTQGVASLLVVGVATYWAAQEFSDFVMRRVGLSQESLSTGVALGAGGFIYFLTRNSSDFALLVLSLGLMMGALMVAIAILAAIHAAWKESSFTPLLGWLVTVVGALALGMGAGFTAVALGWAGAAPLFLKIGGLFAAFVLWTAREFARRQKAGRTEANAKGAEEPVKTAPTPPLHAQRAAILPREGRVLDRLVPVLVCGCLLLLALHGRLSSALSFGPPAVAAPGEVAE